MNCREYGAEKKNEMELPLLEKVKATWTGLSVVFWYAALILIFGRPVLYLVIQTFRFAAFSWFRVFESVLSVGTVLIQQFSF